MNPYKNTMIFGGLESSNFKHEKSHQIEIFLVLLDIEKYFIFNI